MEEIEGKYINEIIRITYKCNWKCKFCNVLKVNNYGENDIVSKEIIYKIISLTKKYNKFQLKNLNLTFSGGEPTLDKNLCNYIKLAKKIGVGIIELQTNGTNLFKNKKFINDLINSGLDVIFLAQHSGNDDINKKLGIYYNINDFFHWVKYIKKNKLNKKINIALNIVITKINLFHIYDYIKYLIHIGFFLINIRNYEKKMNIISFGFCQPNGYAEINKKEVLIKYTKKEITEINNIVELCRKNNIFLDFHFTSPPLCILNYPEYNLEFNRLKRLENDIKNNKVNKTNLYSYKSLFKEKEKIKECKNCINNNYCLGFYKNWIKFVGNEFVNKIVKLFINNGNNGK